MGTYDTARNKTKTAIIESFWKLYCKKDVSKITVRDITEATGIHRATFYLYYDNVFAVLDAIKNEQLEKLKYVCSTYTSSDNDYADFLKAMRRLYDENETISWQQYPEDSTAYFIVDSVLSGMIETFVSCLQTRAFPLESAYQFASQSVDNDIAPAMEREFGITVHPSHFAYTSLSH